MTELENNNYFIKNTLKKYLTPTIISILGTTMITFVNSLLTGNLYGKEALAAMNIINPITFVFAMLGCSISIGGSTSASIAMGKEEDAQVSAYATLSLLLSLVIPIVFSTVGIFFFPQILELLGASGNLYILCEDYGRIILVGGVCTTFMYYPFNFLRVDGRARYSMPIFGMMGVLDFVLVLLFYQAGFGITGVALAVVISTVIADIVGAGILFLGKGKQLTLCIPHHAIRDSIVIIRAGAAAALNNLCNMLRTIVLNALILRTLGEDGASVFAVASAVLNFATAFVAGVGQAVAPLVGVFYGERDDTSIRMLMRSSVRYALILMSSLFGVSLVGCVPLAYAFGMRSWTMVGQTAIAICWMMLSLIPAAVVNCMIFYYMTMNYHSLASILTFLRSFGFVSLLAWLFTRIHMEQWMLASFVCGEVATLLTCLLLTVVIRKLHPQLKGVLLLEYEASEGQYISFSVPGSAEGAVGASAKISEFCEQQELDMRYSMMLPLALEEMLVLVNEHCFEQDESMYADVRIMLSKEEVLLRIRCGGKLFDPIADYRKRTSGMSEEDLLMDESLGIRMITEAAKSVTFRRTLGVNNLVVIL
ncbi:MAG: hypothetical protein J6B28_02685 [Eubacterium sp.]|nr:hypothetical protein [Eubacterium sp.]